MSDDPTHCITVDGETVPFSFDRKGIHWAEGAPQCDACGCDWSDNRPEMVGSHVQCPACRYGFAVSVFRYRE